MADDLKQKGQQDRSRVNMSEDYEVQYWTKKLGVSRDELQDAAGKVGSSARAIKQYLQSKTTH